MIETTLYPDWREKVLYAPDGPQPQSLALDDHVKVVVAGLEAGQQVPAHAEATAIYHILEGRGWLIVDGDRLPVDSGSTVIIPNGAVRGVEATTRLAFLAVRVASSVPAVKEE